MSALDRNQQPEENEDNQSSSLGYLNQNQPPLEDEEDRSSNEQSQTNKRYHQNDKDSNMEGRKIYPGNQNANNRQSYNNRNDVSNGVALDQSIHEGIFLYKPGVQLPNLYAFTNQTIKIIIASEYINKQNPEVIKRNIYGTDPYTSNSDAVCILIHSGVLNINTFQPKKYEGVELYCKVVKPKKNCTGSQKNGMVSRNLKGYDRNLLKSENVKSLTNLPSMALLERYASNMHIPIGNSRIRPKPKNLSNYIPIPETHIVFNSHNEPAYKYSIFNIADKGYDKDEFMIKKLDNFVLYLEAENGDRYELLKKMDRDTFDIIRLSKLKNPEKHDNGYFAQNKSPLAEQLIEVLYPGLDWEEILWGNDSVLIKKDKKRIQNIKSFKFYPRAKHVQSQ